MLLDGLVVVLSSIIDQFITKHHKQKCYKKHSHKHCSHWSLRTEIIKGKYKYCQEDCCK